MFAKKDDNIEDPPKPKTAPPKKKKRKLQLLPPQQDSGSDYQPSEPDYNSDDHDEVSTIVNQQGPRTPGQKKQLRGISF